GPRGWTRVSDAAAARPLVALRGGASTYNTGGSGSSRQPLRSSAFGPKSHPRDRNQSSESAGGAGTVSRDRVSRSSTVFGWSPGGRARLGRFGGSAWSGRASWPELGRWAPGQSESPGGDEAAERRGSEQQTQE